MIAFIDNKDSFTFNIVQTLERVSDDKVVVFSVLDMRMNPDSINAQLDSLS